ncbi:MAG TPA: ATP-binding protein [Leptolyngbyaceae cyanobacterium]
MSQILANGNTDRLDWQDFFDRAKELFCILDYNGYFLQINSAWSNQLGWEKEELLCEATVKFIHSEDINSFSAIFSGQEACFETRYLHKNGSYKWLSWRISSPSPQGLIYAVATDITEYKQEIDALKRERESLYGLLDQLPAFLYIQPQDYGVGFYNQRFKEVFGEPQGRRCYETIAGLKEPCPTCPTFRVFNTETPQIWEWIDNRTGKTYQIYDYPFKDMNGMMHVVEMGLDITPVKQAEAEVRKTSAELAKRNAQLEKSISELQRTQAQLIQTEKMSSLGQLVAGVAHEINNPVSFIHGNLVHANEYIQELISLIDFYQVKLPVTIPEVQERLERIDFDFIKIDLPKLLASMRVGTERIKGIVQSLRTFSRLDEAEMKNVDIHEGIDSTLMILSNRLNSNSLDRPSIQVIKAYGNLPLVECYPGQLNQVFLNIITNAIDALDDSIKYQKERKPLSWQPLVTIRTELNDAGWISVKIKDNGTGMSEQIKQQLFNPFFTTKPVGKGTGLGMSVSYQIVTEKHRGRLICNSILGEGTEFIVEIPSQIGI